MLIKIVLGDIDEDICGKEEKKILKEFVPNVDWISGTDFVNALIKIAQVGNPKIEMRFMNYLPFMLMVILY